MSPPSLLESDRVFARHLDAKETGELRVALTRRSAPVVMDADAQKPAAGTSPAARATPPAMRTPPVFEPGLWRELGELHGCALTATVNSRVIATSLMVANVAYKPEGPPRLVAMLSESSPACQTVAKTIFGLSLSRDLRPAPPGLVEMLVLPWGTEPVSCSDEPLSWQRALPLRVGSKVGDEMVRAPRKTRHVNPVYPANSIEAGTQGMAIFEALISPQGCVRGVRLLRSSSATLLDASALLAVAQWQYTPTVGEKPEPIEMIVTVNFSLQK